MAKAQWMTAFPRLAKPRADALHQQLQTTLSDIRTASILGALTQPAAPQGVQQALNDYTEKIVKDALEGRQTPSVNPIQQKLADQVEMLAAAKAVKVLSEDTPSTPAPSSTAEVVEAAKAMSQIYHDSAQMALEERDRALAEKDEAENAIGAAMKQAREEEAEKSNFIMTILNKSWETQIAAVKEMSQLQIETVKAQAAQQVDALQAQHQKTLDDIKSMVAAALKAKEEEIALLREKAEHEKALIEERHQHALQLKELESKQLLAQAQSQTLPPWEVTYRQGMAEVLVEDKRQEMQDKHAKALADQSFKDSLSELMAALKQHLPDVLASVTNAGPRPAMKHGIPSQPPRPGPVEPPGAVPNSPSSALTGAGASTPITDFAQRRQRVNAGMD